MTSVMGPEERRMLQRAARARSDRAPKAPVRDGDSKRPTARPPAPSAAPIAPEGVDVAATVPAIAEVTAPLEGPRIAEAPSVPEAKVTPGHAPLAMVSPLAVPVPGRAAIAAHGLLALAVAYALMH